MTHLFTSLSLILLLVLPGLALADRASRRTPVVEAVERISDAVVSISTDELVRVRVGGSDWFDEFYRGYYEPPRYKEGYRQASLGSGVLLGPDGYVVTNYHVVRRGARIRVRLLDGRELLAKVVGTDPDSDLAVLQVDGGGALPAAPLAEDPPMLGETVIAIGNPFGLSHTVSTGIVSSLHRDLNTKDQTFFDFIQTDASINPGNSGGPLLNLDGEVIGINTAIYGQGQNIGFAIPAPRVRRVVSDLVSHGRVRESWLGLMVAPVENEHAVVVTGILEGAPAAGLVEPGDLIVALDGRPVSGAAEYRYRLRDIPVGAKLSLRLLRDGSEATVTVPTREIPEGAAEQILARHVGIEVQAVSPKLVKQWRLPVSRGLVVSRVIQGSAAARVGLRKGDVVRAVNAIEVTRLTELREVIAQAEGSGELVLVIQRGRYLHEVSFRL